MLAKSKGPRGIEGREACVDAAPSKHVWRQGSRITDDSATQMINSEYLLCFTLGCKARILQRLLISACVIWFVRPDKLERGYCRDGGHPSRKLLWMAVKGGGLVCARRPETPSSYPLSPAWRGVGLLRIVRGVGMTTFWRNRAEQMLVTTVSPPGAVLRNTNGRFQIPSESRIPSQRFCG